MRHFIKLFVVSSIILVSMAFAQNISAQNYKFENIYKTSKFTIKSKQFKFLGQFVYTNKKRERINEDSNIFEIKNEISKGIITSFTSEDKSFDVNGEIVNYNANYNDDKQTIRLAFQIKTPENKYEIFIDVKRNGNAFLTVKRNMNDFISWTGKVESL